MTRNSPSSCPICGSPLTEGARYCSAACRQKAYRRRKDPGLKDRRSSVTVTALGSEIDVTVQDHSDSPHRSGTHNLYITSRDGLTVSLDGDPWELLAKFDPAVRELHRAAADCRASERRRNDPGSTDGGASTGRPSSTSARAPAFAINVSVQDHSDDSRFERASHCLYITTSDGLVISFDGDPSELLGKFDPAVRELHRAVADADL